jgi:hypothetical protein
LCVDQNPADFSNKVGFYKDFCFNMKGNGQPTVEVWLIESEIAMICIRIAIYITNYTNNNVLQSTPTLTGWRDGMGVFF